MGRRDISICTIGGTGHGKSTLVHAILESLKPGAYDNYNRGVVSTSNYDFKTAAKKYRIHDIPATYVARSFCNSPRYYGAVLVVSSVEGVTPEVRKHVQLARWFGIPTLVPFLNKCDLIDQSSNLLQAKREIRTLLYLNGYRVFDLPISHGSAIECLKHENSGWEGIQSLLDTLDRTIFSPYA